MLPVSVDAVPKGMSVLFPGEDQSPLCPQLALPLSLEQLSVCVERARHALIWVMLTTFSSVYGPHGYPLL